MTAFTILRVIGNLMVLIGHWILFNKNKKYGLTLRITGGFLAIPFSLENQYFDMILMAIMFSIVDIKEIKKLGIRIRKRSRL